MFEVFVTHPSNSLNIMLSRYIVRSVYDATCCPSALEFVGNARIASMSERSTNRFRLSVGSFIVSMPRFFNFSRKVKRLIPKIPAACVTVIYSLLCAHTYTYSSHSALHLSKYYCEIYSSILQ
jgi:hypothetical protein